MKPQVTWCFDPRDIWMGIYWNTMRVTEVHGSTTVRDQRILVIFVCLLPCLPIKMEIPLA